MTEGILKNIDDLQKHLTEAKTNNKRTEEENTYNSLGNAYFSHSEFQRAIYYHKQHLSIAQEVGDRAGEGRVYGNLGKAYHFLGKFQEAINYHNQYLSIAQEVGDRAIEGRVYGNLGTAYHSLGKLQEAIYYHNQCLSIAQEVGDRAAELGAYANLGIAYHSLGKLQEAIYYHNQRLSIAQEVGDRAGERRAYCNLGNAYHSLGKFQEAINYHIQYLSIAQEVGDRAREGCGYANLGIAYHSLGKLQEAIYYHNQCLSIAQEVGDRAGEGRAYCNLGNAYHSLGKFQEAINYHNQCLRIAQEVGDRAREGRGYANLGSAYHSLGKLQDAINYYSQDLSIAKEVGDRAREGCAYYNLGTAYAKLKNFQQAMEYQTKCLSICLEVRDRHGEGLAYGSLGDVYYSLKNFQKAIEYQKKCLSIAKEVCDRDGEGNAYCKLGMSYRSLDEFEQAIDYLRQFLSIAEEVGSKHLEGEAHCWLGGCLLESGCLNEALFHFITSVEILDAIRASCISEDALKISFRNVCNSAYNFLWQVQIMLQLTDEALYAAEKGRAQALVDALKINYGLTSFSLKSDESEEELTVILKKISVSTVFLAVQKKTINMWVLRKGRNVIFRQAELKVESAHEDYFAVLLETTLKKIKAGVNVRCENRSLDERKDNQTSSTEKDDQTSELLHETIDCFKPLYDAVIGPIEDFLDGDELIVVPDGALSLAPWAALSESLRIRTIPSLTSLKLIIDSPDEYHCKSGALLVGDPCLKKFTTKLGYPIYDQLEYAKKEVEIIGEILKCKPLTGEAATKQEVLRRINSVALVHIAAHGSKETGEIALAPDPCWESKIPKEENFLRMSDIQAVKLRARLVVLSCCHSGQGEVSSEGVVGIARAFLFAGARSVVATLWAINDETTLEFMKSFYQHLRGGESASYALQVAMKCLRDSDKFSAPKYWAPFVLIGDDVTIEFDESNRESRK